MTYYPVFLDIRGRLCVVVGGGAVASQKIKALLDCGAKVAVISREIQAGIRRLAQKRRIRWIKALFHPKALDGAFLAIAATDDAQVNRRVWEAAQGRGVLVNVVDDPPHCHFIAPSLFRRGKLQMAISTGGASPAIAKTIRKKLADVFGPEYAAALDWMGSARAQVKRRVPTQARRKALFSALAATDIPGTVLRRGRKAAHKRFAADLKRLLSRYGD